MPVMNFSLINTKLEQLRSLMPMKAEYQQKLDNKFRMEFNYNSNHMEGNTLTYGETVLLLIHGQTKGNHEYREYDEMKAHDVALEIIKEWASDKEKPLTEADIKNLNRILLVEPFWKEALTADGQPTRRQIKIGEYKEHPNSVRLQNGEMFEYASPMDTPIQMGELIQWFREEEEKKELHPIQLAALLHYKFVRIHPFDDGNGRISRLLMNYVLLKNDYPPIIIKSDDKKNYLRALNLADTGDLDAFIAYIAEQALWSIDISIKAAKGESIDEPGDFDKKVMALKKKHNYKEEIKIFKNKDAILDCYKNSILPIIIEIKAKLEKLKVFFKNQEEKFIVSVTGEPFISIFNDADSTYSNLEKRQKIDRIRYEYIMTQLRNAKSKTSFYIRMDVMFHDFVYEIKFESYGITYDMLYHEFFTIEQLEDISEKIANQFFEQVETALSKNN